MPAWPSPKGSGSGTLPSGSKAAQHTDTVTQPVWAGSSRRDDFASSGRRRYLALDDRWPTAAALCDLHAARLRLLGNRDPQCQHTLIVVSLKPVGIEAVTEQQLTGKRCPATVR
jgi:hypothetical protein